MPVAEGAGSVVAVILVGYVRTLSEIVPTVPRTAARTFRRASGACRITLEQSRRYPFSRLSGRPRLESLEAVLTYSQARKDLREVLNAREVSRLFLAARIVKNW